MKRCNRAVIVAAAAAASGVFSSLTPSALGVNYTWQVLNSGNATGSWGVATNWNPNLPGATTGADSAFFNGLDVSVDSIVSLNAPQTIGNMTFGDTNTASAAGWTLNATSATPNDGTNILTLNAGGGYELVTVNALGAGKVVTINAALSNGSGGDLALAKAGRGTLVLTANNSTLTGTTAVNNGTLILDFSQAWSPVTNILGDSGTGHLQLQGGVLHLKGKAATANSQSFTNGTALELGASTLRFEQNGATSISAALNGLTRNVGSTLDVVLPTTGTVTYTEGPAGSGYPHAAFGVPVAGAGPIADGNGSHFMTVNGGADWAASSGGTVVPAATIGGFYTASTATAMSGNADVVTNVNLAAGTSVTSMRFNDATARTINLNSVGLATGGIIVTPGSGGGTIQNGQLNGTNLAGGELFISQNSANPLTISADIIEASATSLTKSGSGTLILSGNNTYAGQTTINQGVVSVTAGNIGSRTVLGLPDVNVEIAPAFGNSATLLVSGGTVNADRLIVAGNGGNFAGGDGALIQTGGTINSGLWFAVGSVGNGRFDMSGGTLNQNHDAISQMEVGVFGSGSSVVNLSGTAQINLFSNANLAMGVVNNTGTAIVNQNGGQITFFSNAGTLIGGGGNVVVGGGGTGRYTYNLNGGTLLTNGVVKAGAAATGTFNFNGGTLKAARNNASFLANLTAANVQAGGAVIDSNGFTVTVPQPLLHDSALGATPDGGLIKNGAGVLRLSGVSTYTGATVVNAGTIELPSSGVPAPVGSYTFEGLAQGALAGGTTVANAGSGGAGMNGSANHANHLLDPTNGGATIVPGRFGSNGLRLDGLGSSVDVASQIVDQAPAGSWTLSTWVKTTSPGAGFLGKNQGGNGWVVGFSQFYLSGQLPGAGAPPGPGPYPTAVRFAGDFMGSNTPIPLDDTWHMITYVDNAGVKSIYVDGVLTTLSRAGVNNSDTSTVSRIGKYIAFIGDGGADFTGDLDEMQFYDVALTAAQITQLFNTNAVTTGSPPVGQVLPVGTAMNLAGATSAFDLNGANQTIGSLAGVPGSQVVLRNAARLTLGGNNTSTTFAGAVSGSGGITKVGTGTQTLTGANNYTGTTIVNGGRLKLGNAAHGPVLTGAGGADIQAGRLLLDYNGGSTPATTVRNILDASFNSGFATGQIRSSTATTAIGLGWADDTTAKIVTIARTYYGDAQLDGDVDLDDIGPWSLNFTGELGGVGATKVWAQGDWDYDGDVDLDDVGRWSLNFTGELGGNGLGVLDLGSAMASVHPTALSALNSLGITVVPEPASIGVLGLGLAAAIGKRRRRGL